jgi:uncharacterized damage-inducible protein DinB
MQSTIDPRFPIGRYETAPYTEATRTKWLNDIRFLPQALENSILNLDEAQLETPYREGGWTVKQLVHHVADSHINAYIRFKLGVTENTPPVKPYEEKLWAELADVKALPINVSLTLLHALHARWTVFLESLTPEEFERKVFHPEHKKEMTLWFLLGMYAWHSRHHVAHITTLREEKGW